MSTVVDELYGVIKGTVNLLLADNQIAQIVGENVVEHIEPEFKYNSPIILVSLPPGQDVARRAPDNVYYLLDPILTIEVYAPFSLGEETVITLASRVFELLTPGPAVFAVGDKHASFFNRNFGTHELVKDDSGNRWKLVQKWNVKVT
jgi:hypothetical protein